MFGKDTVFGCYLSLTLAGIQIAAVYNVPSLPITMDELLKTMMTTARINLSKPLMILGDFNARLVDWDDSVDNVDGVTLYAWMSVNSLERSSSGPLPTFDSGRGRSLVDHVFSNIPARS